MLQQVAVNFSFKNIECVRQLLVGQVSLWVPNRYNLGCDYRTPVTTPFPLNDPLSCCTYAANPSHHTECMRKCIVPPDLDVVGALL